jgi:WD40 repeat protein
LDAATGKTERVVEQEKRSGNQGSAVGLYRYLTKTVAFGPQGKVLLVQQFGGGVVKSYDLDSGQWHHPMEKFAFANSSNFSVTPDGSRLVASTMYFLISWDVAKGQPKELNNTAPKDFSFGGPPLIAVSADGNLFATAGSSVVGLRRTADGTLIGSIAGVTSDDLIFSLAFSPDGKFLAVGAEKRNGTEGWLRLCDPKTLQPQKELPGQAFARVTFSPDSNNLAVGSGEHVDLVEVVSGQTLRELPGGGYVTSVAYSPDGKLLAAGDTTGRVSLWDPVSGRMIWTVEVPGTWGVSWVVLGAMLVIWALICYKLAIRRKRNGILVPSRHPTT